jgi:hypothetical protein
MKKEACIPGCKYNHFQCKCELYNVPIRIETVDVIKGFTQWCKCEECMEKELSCLIDENIREIYSFYHAFTQEMNIQFSELESLVKRREDIYK